MIAPSTRSLHCLSAFRAFPATMAETQTSLTVHRSSLPFGVQGVPRPKSVALESIVSTLSSLPFGVQGVPRKKLHTGTLRAKTKSSLPFGVQGVPRFLAVGPQSGESSYVFIAFRRSGRSPLGGTSCVPQLSIRSLHCLSAFRAFPATLVTELHAKAESSLHCLSAFRAFPAGFIRLHRNCLCVGGLHCLSAFRAFPATLRVSSR